MELEISVVRECQYADAGSIVLQIHIFDDVRDEGLHLNEVLLPDASRGIQHEDDVISCIAYWKGICICSAYMWIKKKIFVAEKN